MTIEIQISLIFDKICNFSTFWGQKFTVILRIERGDTRVIITISGPKVGTGRVGDYIVIVTI